MIYMLARSFENDEVIALVVVNQLPKSTILREQIEMDFAGWLDEEATFYLGLEEIEHREWETYQAFGMCKPYRIRCETETRYVEGAKGRGVETAVERNWSWDFFEAPDLEL